jgi:uncharacterized membrane protein
VLLVIAPLMWAGNAVVGRLVHELVPPITLNFLRWLLAFGLLLPLAHGVLRPDSPVWPHWRRYALLGLLGIGTYNALQYLALQTSTPINVTLVGSSMPVWMLAVGALCFGAAVTRQQLVGAALSMAGVLLVLSRGEWSQLLSLRLVPGDVHAAGHGVLGLLQLAAGTHQRTRKRAWRLGGLSDGPNGLRPALVGRLCRSRMGAGPQPHHLGLAAGGCSGLYRHRAAVVAYRCWGVGVCSVRGQRLRGSSPTSHRCLLLMSAAFLGEAPRAYPCALALR